MTTTGLTGPPARRQKRWTSSAPAPELHFDRDVVDAFLTAFPDVAALSASGLISGSSCLHPDGSVSGMRGLVGTDPPRVVALHAARWAHGPGKPADRWWFWAGRAHQRPHVREAATAGIMSTGAEVIDLGVVPRRPCSWRWNTTGRGRAHPDGKPNRSSGTRSSSSGRRHLSGCGGRPAVRALAEAGRRARIGVGSGRCGPTRRGGAPPRAVLALPVIDVGPFEPGGSMLAIDCVRGAGGSRCCRCSNASAHGSAAFHLEPDGRFPHPPEPVAEKPGRSK